MAAKILSKLVGEGVGEGGGGGEDREQAQHRSQHFYRHADRTFTHNFSAQTPRILSPSPLCVAGDICSARLRSLRPVFRRFQFLLCAVCSIVAKVTPDKDGTGDANAARLSRQRCRGGWRASSAGELRTDREATLIRALAGRSKKFAQKKGACQAATASKPVTLKVSCEINRKYSEQVDFKATTAFLSPSPHLL